MIKSAASAASPEWFSSHDQVGRCHGNFFLHLLVNLAASAAKYCKKETVNKLAARAASTEGLQAENIGVQAEKVLESSRLVSMHILIFDFQADLITASGFSFFI